jgi:tetratricopeptide (TPR) repeat protein
MEPEETAGGIAYLIRSVTPVIGRVGAVASGIIGLLIALEKVSGEIITALGGFLLVVTIVASAVVVWGRQTRDVGGTPRSLPLYPKRHRRIALAVLLVTALLTVLFTVRVSGDYLRSEQAARQAAAVDVTPLPTVAVAPPATALPGSPTSVFGRVGDVKSLNQTGFDALATRNYTIAISAFFRALEVDATSAQSQLGLGESYYYTAQYTMAVLPLRTALQLNSTLNDAHAYLGLVYEQRGDLVRARVELEEYLRISPKDAPLRAVVTDALKRVANSSRTGPTPAPTR